MKKIYWPLIIIGAGVFGALLNLEPALAILGILGLVVLCLSQNIVVGGVLMVLTGFLTGLEIDFSRFAWARDLPYLPSINAPIADFVALSVFLALALAWFISEKPNGGLYKVKIPGWYWYVLFLIAGLASVWFAPASDRLLILKAWARPQVFVYLCLFLTFIQAVRDRINLDVILKVWFGVGVFSAVFAAVSLVIGLGNATWRATPFAIAGIAPFGYNHNLLAEALVATLPVALYFLVNVKEVQKKYLYGLVTISIGVFALLTLSRAAWLAVLVIGVIFAHHFRVRLTAQKHFNLLSKPSRTPIYSLIVLLPLIVYMGFFLSTGTVASSTSARWEVTKIVWWNAARAPWFGYGPGQFVTVLGENALYILEFGDPLDAHGFLQKILLENGFIGLTFFLLFLGTLLWTFFVKKPKLATSELFLAQSLVLSSVVFQLFNTSYYHAVFWLPLALAVIILNVGKEHV